MSTLAEALRTGTVVADGGLSTELESRGHDVTSSLWSARLLRDDPAAITAAHAAFARAGAQVATTASYQASFPGFAAAGIDGAQARTLMARSVQLARDGLALAGRDGWVAGSVGPYGAFLADGSEYTGDYVDHVSVAELRAFHRPRLAVLAEAGADVLACETLPAAAEVEALLTELDELGVPAWLSLTSTTGPDRVPRTRRGERLDEVCAMARDVDAVIAVGVNCTDPAGVPAALAAAAASGKPGVAYPNSGEAWDANARRWTGRPGVGDVSGWLAAGARLVGGCCRVRPDDVRTLADAVPLPRD
ncbi:homocysteine S-methyltransferase [Modestobacter sp. VKM Ac-2977]|uniref:homocysteine S-methyltransferase n=1 Tax=Modestobacter sp. VKM Ac-2977 TaxID=3004131 RepID=UPI0022AACDA4|nr:homocysteine S-methyltransferase [Modestobacter sp. VKM Ac-2977]MCZ2820150.1 homocysteine S-methyltransferase [Modestobacter sp. VKM Ac-2977]